MASQTRRHRSDAGGPRLIASSNEKGGDDYAPFLAERSALFRSTPPVKEATSRFFRVVPQSCGFDPRPREGGDIAQVEPSSPHRSFEPRPREGGDNCESSARAGL